jgi:hypothetical protein
MAGWFSLFLIGILTMIAEAPPNPSQQLEVLPPNNHLGDILLE